jgi:hypothetical protein
VRHRRSRVSLDSVRATLASEAAPDLQIDLHEEETPTTAPEALDHAMRLLARLLVRAATAPNPKPVADAEKPLDVAVVPKVGLDRE